MQFLFEAIAFDDEKPVFYRVYRIEDHRYFLENVDDDSRGFYMNRAGEEWTADDPQYQKHADVIGEEVNLRSRIK